MISNEIRLKRFKGSSNRTISYLYLLSALMLVVFCLLKLPSSPLRSGNTWDDTNAMLRMGQLWLRGHIPFKDAFEQRGPIMYLFYLIANLVSKTGYIGLFVIEIVNVLAIQFFIKKILILYFNNKKDLLTTFGSLIIPLLSMSSFSFKNGGSPEEFAIVWILISVYAFQQFLVDHQERHFLMVGVSFAIIFNLKYSLIGPWLAIVIMTIICVSNYYLNLKDLIKSIGKILLHGFVGMLIVFIPVILYFLISGALASFIHVYFVVNLTAYSKGNLPFFAHLLESLAMSVRGLVNGHMLIFLLFSISLIGLKNRRLVSGILLTFMCTGGLGFWSLRPGDYTYHVLIFMMYFTIVLEMIKVIPELDFGRDITVISLVAVTTLFVAFSTYNNPALMLSSFGHTNPANIGYKFAKIIKSKKNETSVLYFDQIDFGIERYLNVPAKNYYFERTNLNIASQNDALKHSVEKRKTEYIVVKLRNVNKEIVRNNYKRIGNGYKYKYFLLNNYKIKLVRIPYVLMQRK